MNDTAPNPVVTIRRTGSLPPLPGPASHAGFSAASAIDGSLREPGRAEFFARLFSTLLRQRLALFRLSALPAGQNSYPEDIPIALRAAQFERASEQELLLAQVILTDRRENLAPLYRMDRRLKYEKTTKYRQVSELVPMEAAVQPSD